MLGKAEGDYKIGKIPPKAEGLAAMLTSNRFWLIHPCDRERQMDRRAIA